MASWGSFTSFDEVLKRFAVEHEIEEIVVESDNVEIEVNLMGTNNRIEPFNYGKVLEVDQK